jgi:hypothetical protein
VSATPLIAEDLLLLLFDPRSGTIAGEGTLFYTLAGAVLADLAAGGHIEVDEDTTLAGRPAGAGGRRRSIPRSVAAGAVGSAHPQASYDAGAARRDRADAA